MDNFSQTIDNAAAYLQEQLGPHQPTIGLILGSGLGVMADEINNPVVIPYANIPGFPVPTVEGHSGQFVIGELEGKTVMAMQGRFHFYEGYSQKEVTLPVRVMKKCGVEIVVLTNAAGGVNLDFKAGDLMLINDHINFTLTNPLLGKNMEEFGPRFPDMSAAYDPELRQLARTVAGNIGVELKEGVYQYLTGPTYETPAEVIANRILGADANGMSTVPEAISAVHSGMKVLGISCISNLAAGILDQPLTHEEVIETTDRIRGNFSKLIRGIVQSIPN